MLKTMEPNNKCDNCGKRMLISLSLCEDCREEYDESDCLEDRLQNGISSNS